MKFRIAVGPILTGSIPSVPGRAPNHGSPVFEPKTFAGRTRDERADKKVRAELQLEGQSASLQQGDSAVGYRSTAGRVTVFHVPDVAYIYERAAALRGVQLYIGDGEALTRSLVRRRDDRLIGHTPVQTQLTWCEKERVPRAVVTHCGSEIVEGDERKIAAQINRMARERDIEATIAHDGMEMTLR